MQLHDLTPPKKSRFSRKRLGCGPGSGLGKTSGRGENGQKSRSGGGVRPGFEGGQTPIYRRLPRRGFSNFRYTTVFEVINICDLAKFKAGTEITAEVLAKAGLVRNSRDAKLKVLGTGEISVSLIIKADKFSKSAESKITAAGGTCEVIGKGSSDEATEKVAEKKVTAKKTTEKKVAEKKVTAKKVTEEKVTEKKVAEKKVTAKKATEEKVTEKKVTEKKVAAKKTTKKAVEKKDPKDSKKESKKSEEK